MDRYGPRRVMLLALLVAAGGYVALSQTQTLWQVILMFTLPLGVAYNWGEANDTTFASDLPTQHGLELFYRLQLADELAITPSLEYIRNPALNPDQDAVWLFGLRARLAL